MAPPERDFVGHWGKPTSTIDWCESNYEVTPYIAEFWNTVSNVLMILPPLVGALLAYKDGVERRFMYCHLALMVVGIGSWLFHGTLLFEMQLMDELPMIWGSSFMVYSLMEIDCAPNTNNFLLQMFLGGYCLVVTVVYLTIHQPIFHQIAYGLMVFAMLAYSIRIVRKFEHSYSLFITGFSSYGIGFFLWNMDNIFCSHFRETRNQLGYPVKPLLQGHAWWHVFAGMGTYLGLLFITDARCRYLKQHSKTKFFSGIFPFLECTQKAGGSRQQYNGSLKRAPLHRD